MYIVSRLFLRSHILLIQICNFENMTSTSIKTVGVIGTGVIGASWTALFLAKGLRVIVTDPAPGAESKLYEYLRNNYLAIPNKIVTPDKYLNNLTFVKDIDPYLGELDLIQEVSQWRLRSVRVPR